MKVRVDDSVCCSFEKSRGSPLMETRGVNTVNPLVEAGGVNTVNPLASEKPLTFFCFCFFILFS